MQHRNHYRLRISCFIKLPLNQRVCKTQIHYSFPKDVLCKEIDVCCTTSENLAPQAKMTPFYIMHFLYINPTPNCFNWDSEVWGIIDEDETTLEYSPPVLLGEENSVYTAAILCNDSVTAPTEQTSFFCIQLDCAHDKTPRYR